MRDLLIILEEKFHKASITGTTENFQFEESAILVRSTHHLLYYNVGVGHEAFITIRVF